jgi:hypothetical protein
MCHKNSFTFCGQAKKKGETSWYFDSDKKSFEGGYSLRQTKNFLRSLENNKKCNKAKKMFVKIKSKTFATNCVNLWADNWWCSKLDSFCNLFSDKLTSFVCLRLCVGGWEFPTLIHLLENDRQTIYSMNVFFSVGK